MPTKLLRGLCAAALLTLSSVPAFAQAVAAEQEPVHVSALRNPELKRYRAMAAGLDAFDDNRALAPQAKELRFKLRPRASAASDAMDKLTLHITGDTVSIPVPIGTDGSFVLPRSEQADDENADLMLNKKKGGFRWHADVRSAGVPDGMRRLGDLRLECRVMVAVAKEEMPLWVKLLVNSFLLTTDWCSVEKLQLSSRADRKISAATLVDGAVRKPLELSDEGMGFVAPLGDRRFPNDARIEFQFAADAPAVPAE
ncbi:hypothetical protein [Pseudoduganella sp. GCM10020061]|uniref:hypothetical protein n=1 Tax=Pseudoduganella sp. GCM10020061 TaxID=3317345 RepID=UPI00363DF008